LIRIPVLSQWWRVQRLNADLDKVVLETAKSLGQPTVSELVDHLINKKGLKFKDATKAVYVEWKKGTLDLSEAKPSSSLPSYLFNLENMWFWATTILVALTLLVVFTVDSTLLIYVRYVLGGVFILFLPGFMLISALYPRGRELDELERVALSIGLSLAIVPLVGLILNYTPWGITLTPIMISLAVFSEAMAFGTLVRKYQYYKIGSK
jgi:hypothetical protein